MATDRDRVLSEFIDAWNAGRRPDPDDYLARVDPEDQDALLASIDQFLTWAPTPDYDEATLLSIESEPIVAEGLAAFEQRSGLWPALLPRLRSRMSLTTAQVARQLVSALDLPETAEKKTRRYVEQMEGGKLEPAGVSRRVIDALASILHVSGPELEGAGDLGSWHAAAPAAVFRAEESMAETLRDDLAVFAKAAAAPSERDWDEVDELFRGGR